MIRRREKPVILYHLYNGKDEYGQPRLEWDEKITTSGLYIIKGIFTRMSPEYEDIDGTLLLKESTFGPDWLVSIDNKNYRIQYVYPQMNCNRYTSYYLKSTKEEPLEHIEYGVYWKLSDDTTLTDAEGAQHLHLRGTPAEGYVLARFETSETAPPWTDDSFNIYEVTFEEAVKPTTIYRWFDASNVITIHNLNNLDLTVCESMQWSFRDCHNLIDDIKFSTGAPLNTSLRSAFKNCNLVKSIDVSNLCTSNCTSLNSVFHSCYELTKIIGLDTFDTSNVTEFTCLFNFCYLLTDVSGVAGWDTRNVEMMNGVFYSCRKLPFIHIPDWDFSKATTMANMFRDCAFCHSIDIKKFTPPTVLTTMSRLFDDDTVLCCINCDDIYCNYPAGCTVSNVFRNCTSLLNWGEGTSADSWNYYVRAECQTCPTPYAVTRDYIYYPFTVDFSEPHTYYYSVMKLYLPDGGTISSGSISEISTNINVYTNYDLVNNNYKLQLGNNPIKIIIFYPDMLSSCLDYNIETVGYVPEYLIPQPTYDPELGVYMGDCSALTQYQYYTFNIKKVETGISWGSYYYWRYGDYLPITGLPSGEYTWNAGICDDDWTTNTTYVQGTSAGTFIVE